MATLVEPEVTLDGLTSVEAAHRLTVTGANVLPAPRRPSAARQLAAEVTHFFALLLWVESNHYRVAGELREVYLRFSADHADELGLPPASTLPFDCITPMPWMLAEVCAVTAKLIPVTSLEPTDTGLARNAVWKFTLPP